MGEGKENKNNKLSPNGGFSLIELVISILMLIIVMLPLLNSFYQSARLNQKAKELQTQQKQKICRFRSSLNFKLVVRLLHRKGSLLENISSYYQINTPFYNNFSLL